MANRTAGTQTAGTQTADTETADTQTAGTTVPLVEGGTFPLRVEPGLRYLVDASGSPFLMQGEAAWSLIAQLCREEVDIYLDDRKARGFNTILVNLVEHKFASNAPSNCYGDAPFTNPDDMSTPNEAYFEHADWVMQRAAALDFAVLLVPSYAGYTGTDEGWYSEMQASGPDKLREYGRYVGERYQHFSNIVWVQGGDDNPPDKELVDAISEGIAEFMPTALQTAHTGPETSALDYWGDRPWLDVNNVYTYGDVYTPAIKQY